MALHIAEQIMASLKTTLTGLTTTTTFIERARVYPFDVNIKNALTLSMGTDELLDENELTFEKVDSLLTFFVDAHVKTNSVQIDTQLNLIRAEVVTAIMSDHTQGGLVIDTDEAGSEEPEISGSGDTITAMMRMSFVVRYRRSRTDPTAS